MHHEPEDTQGNLLLLASQGEEQAFAQLFHQYRNKIFTIAHKLTESVEASEEIVQDVFLKVWLKRESLSAVEDFDSWLFIIARNTAYSFLRSTARKILHPVEPDPELLGISEEAEAKMMEKQLKAALKEAVEKLPSQQKLVYILSREEGLKHEDIASRINIAPETVKKHLQYAMKTIRAYVISNLDLGLILLFLWKNS